MSNTQLIYSDPNKAYRSLITTAELDQQFTKLKKEFKLPVAPTSKDFDNATKNALLQMFA